MNAEPVFLLGGTSESREAARFLCDAGYAVSVSVTTPDAQRLYAGIPNLRVLVGPLLKGGLGQVFKQSGVQQVIDATHPFAVSISQTAMEVCAEMGIPYIRFERAQAEEKAGSPFVTVHEDIPALLASHSLQGKRVLLALGHKGLRAFSPLRNEATFYVRVLKEPASRAAALQAGFSEDRLIPLSLPWLEADERALWQKLGIEAVVAKASGPRGGEEIKRGLADELHIQLHLLRRPTLPYPRVAYTLEELRQQLRPALVEP